MVKQVFADIAAVELVAELVQVLLQELRLNTVVHVGQLRLGVADGGYGPTAATTQPPKCFSS